MKPTKNQLLMLTVFINGRSMILMSLVLVVCVRDLGINDDTSLREKRLVYFSMTFDTVSRSPCPCLHVVYIYIHVYYIYETRFSRMLETFADKGKICKVRKYA